MGRAEAADSFEDTPPGLSGYLRRDRRWCQGNMQHLRLLAVPGLHPVSRFHLFQGAMAYLASVWWLVLMVLWAVPGQGHAAPDLFATHPFLPVWPTLPPVTQGTIAASVGFLILAPRLFGVVAHLRDAALPVRRLPGFAAAVVIEVVLSALLAPALMVHQVRAVLRTLLGFDGGWMPHQTGRTGLAALLRLHGTETVLGLFLMALWLTGWLTPWLLPVAVGLCLAVPLSALVQSPLRLPGYPGMRG
jgi:membrane glycosyltransferase